MAIQTSPFDPADHLGIEGILDVLDDAIASDDTPYVEHALDTSRRAKGFRELAARAAKAPDQLYAEMTRGMAPGVGAARCLRDALRAGT